MSSVAYSAHHRAPSSWRTAWDLMVGWVLGAACLVGLYLAGWALGVIGVIGANNGIAGQGVINQWPFSENGWWSLAANFSALVLALLVVTATTAWKLRESFETVSEARLAVVLFFTGGVPFVTPEKSRLLIGFLIAIWLVRTWAVRAEHRLSRRALGLSAFGLILTMASYGALHPVWVESATVFPSHTLTNEQTTLVLTLHNVSRASLEVEGLSGGPFFPRAVAGLPTAARPAPAVRIASRASKTFALPKKLHGCATQLPDARIRYRVFGLSLSSPLRIEPLGFSCPSA